MVLFVGTAGLTGDRTCRGNSAGKEDGQVPCCGRAFGRGDYRQQGPACHDVGREVQFSYGEGLTGDVLLWKHASGRTRLFRLRRM